MRAPRQDFAPCAYLGRRQKFALIASALLLALVGIKAFGNLGRQGPLLKRFPWMEVIVETITQISVLQADYGFFSPDIAPDTRLEITVARKGGPPRPVCMSFPNREIKLRFHTSVTVFRMFGPYREILARSLAAKAYTANPNAAFIVVTAYDYRLPSRAAFRRGEQSSEEEFFQVSFSTSNGRGAN